MPSFRAPADRPLVSGDPEAEVWSSAAQAPPIPKYYRLRADLGRQITEGHLSPGTFLPPERVLLQQHRVSRTTLREALRPLLMEGTLVSVRGKGIMIAQRTIRQLGDMLVSFSDVLRAQGLQPGIRGVRVTMGPCSREVAAALQLQADAAVLQVDRVRTGDGQPVNFSVSYLPAADVPQLSGKMLEDSGSLYQLLKTRYEIHIARAEDEMWARRASRQEAHLLGTRPGDPVLILRRVCVLHTGRPIEYALSVIRSDIFRYVVRLTPPRPGSL